MGDLPLIQRIHDQSVAKHLHLGRKRKQGKAMMFCRDHWEVAPAYMSVKVAHIGVGEKGVRD